MKKGINEERKKRMKKWRKDELKQQRNEERKKQQKKEEETKSQWEKARHVHGFQLMNPTNTMGIFSCPGEKAKELKSWLSTAWLVSISMIGWGQSTTGDPYRSYIYIYLYTYLCIFLSIHLWIYLSTYIQIWYVNNFYVYRRILYCFLIFNATNQVLFRNIHKIYPPWN